MTTSILCVIDFLNSSNRALEWAVTNASKLKMHLTVLYPYRLIQPRNGESLLSMKEKLENEAVRNFRVLEEDLLINTGVCYDFKSEVGFVANRVEGYSKTHKINFLVIDKNMHTLDKESLDDLIKYLTVPLVIIP